MNKTDLINDLKAKLKILELENEFLSQKAEENQLLSRTFEEINILEGNQIQYQNILESISILLDIEYSGVFTVKNNRLINVTGYSLTEEDDPKNLDLRISDEMISKIKYGETILMKKTEQEIHFNYIQNKKESYTLLFVPFKSPDSYNFYLFASNDDGNILEIKELLLERIAEITEAKIEGLYYQSELDKLNKELEKRVSERTKELRKSKERAEESDRLKSVFINNMSHEIRTPLNGILGFTQLLLNSDEIDQNNQNNYIDIINSSGNRLLKIFEDLLEISELEAKSLKAYSNKLCINELISKLDIKYKHRAEEKNIEFHSYTDISDFDSCIESDESKISRIMNALTDNALKFTEKGSVEIGYVKKEDSLEFYVKDTGIGIDSDYQDEIFKRFTQINSKPTEPISGLGLGLSIAKENAELLGSEIKMLSKKGTGSKFYFTIPYKKVYREEEQGKITTFKKVLIAEDEEINFLFLESVLIDMNEDITILHALNGKETVRIAQENDDIDLILMDLKMPIMNGFEATEIIRKQNPEIVIIAQTAYTSKEDIDKALDVGCDHCIIKPIEIDQFHELIKNYLKIEH